MQLPFSYVRPDFAIVGSPHGDQVMLWASKTLTQAQLETEAEWDWAFNQFYDTRILTSQIVTLTLESRDYVLIFASDYNLAFVQLFKMWSPDDLRAKPQEIDQGQRKIER